MAPPTFFLTRDARILDLIRRGDEEALVMLFHDTRATVTDLVLRNNGSLDDAEDILQEALVILWKRVRSNKFEHAAKLSTFVFGVARNLWLRVLAGRKREPLMPVDYDPADTGDSFEESLLRDEEAELVRRALDTIDVSCRKLLLLFYWEERSMEEIAGIMGFANSATAKSKKYQCKKHLEVILKSFEADQ
ncbi:MAG: RNA polymerase sigma factor [Bacteroidota bacterium]